MVITIISNNTNTNTNTNTTNNNGHILTYISTNTGQMQSAVHRRT